MKKTAWISTDGVYRYALTRIWEPRDRELTWIMLNPSTADAEVDDPTIRRCMSFARRWGYGGITVANLFALRSTSPKMLRSHPDPVGPKNDIMLQEIGTYSPVVVAAWGTNGRLMDRDLAVRRIVPNLFALGFTKNGSPLHPLYVHGDTQLVKWDA